MWLYTAIGGVLAVICNQPNLSIVIPMFNEEDVISQTLNRVDSVASNLNLKSIEVILVDDGSKDKSVSIAKGFQPINFKLRIILMRGNQGHMRALTAGMQAAYGSLIVSLDADLQDPPELIEEMIHVQKLTQCDVVQSVRRSRSKDTTFKRFTAALYYKLLALLVGESVIYQGADYRLMTYEVAQELVLLPEQNKVYRLLISQLGYKIQVVEFDRDSRVAGETKYNFVKMLKLAIDSIISFSTKPLQTISAVAVLLSGILFVCGVFVLVSHFFVRAIPGWTSVVLLLLSTQCLILLAIATVGEYVARIFEQVQGRPNVRWVEMK